MTRTQTQHFHNTTQHMLDSAILNIINDDDEYGDKQALMEDIIAKAKEAFHEFKQDQENNGITTTTTTNNNNNEEEKGKNSMEMTIQESKPVLQVYSNGDSYLGSFDPISMLRSGHGVYITNATGAMYVGEFKNSMKHGYGMLTLHDKKYKGEFRFDRKHGCGTLILSNTGRLYHGSFRNDAYEGRGTLWDKNNGTKYVGEWHEGIKEGFGMEYFENGRVYIGEYKAGKCHGHGTMLDGQHVIYRGEWNNGYRHGHGISIYREETFEDDKNNTERKYVYTKFEGHFVHGKKHGYGALTNDTEGTVQKGTWHDDVPTSGKWRIQNERDGSVYCGHVMVVRSDGSDEDDLMKIMAVPHGFGSMKYGNGDNYSGMFELGDRTGEGVCVFANGDKWEGDWTKDEMDTNGNGILTKVDGTVKHFVRSSFVPTW
eukprot:CAMPEP_0118676338 /NCGR_PEP_ID=MMETSP0800-20121206/1991_1 /TAXON_ID=210618 ORGANISM="Striatella unipunctata, Strain CCMP2910" /NCGR_SAMPLE_ID=MMETSP0800 /ASSEMBLY_ACC=CAM_ASM_000638 /LENGTH=427 /DNA_ID=CAMNT_0006571839 /DNA_START=38 /DNA_END=1321 /DNA_ORIENTATION=-